nr:unnamed protein product [Digitaria exilis]
MYIEPLEEVPLLAAAPGGAIDSSKSSITAAALTNHPLLSMWARLPEHRQTQRRAPRTSLGSPAGAALPAPRRAIQAPELQEQEGWRNKGERRERKSKLERKLNDYYNYYQRQRKGNPNRKYTHQRHSRRPVYERGTATEPKDGAVAISLPWRQDGWTRHRDRVLPPPPFQDDDWRRRKQRETGAVAVIGPRGAELHY